MPLKCTMLLWLIFQNSLPTNACRAQRGMTNDSACSFCSHPEETMLHCLRECSLASSIWQTMGYNTGTWIFSIMDIKVWLRELLKEDDLRAIATLWWVWRARTTWCMEQAVPPVQALASCATAMMHDVARGFVEAFRTMHREPRLVKWVTRLPDCVVVNVDGSIKGSPSRGGIGGCLRSSHGQWQGGFYGFRDDSSILHLELQAMHQGLQIAWNKGLRLVECQSDSLEVVSLVISGPPLHHLYATLIWDIKDLLARDWMVDLHHVLRQGNACANFLAKHGADQGDELVIIAQPMVEMGLILLADASGVASLRT